MPIGVYNRVPGAQRVARVTIVCEVCKKERQFLPGEVKQRGTIRFCSYKCSGIAKRKANTRTCLKCGHCGEEFTKRTDHVTKRNYCSKACSDKGRRVDGAKWRDPQQVKQYMADYVQANKTHLYAKSVERDRQNPEARKERSKRWRDSHKEYIRASAKARRFSKKASDFTEQQWIDLKTKYDNRCLCCDKQEPDVVLQADHVIPFKHGGVHDVSNIQPLCKECNLHKMTKHTDYRHNRTERKEPCFQSRRRGR